MFWVCRVGVAGKTALKCESVATNGVGLGAGVLAGTPCGGVAATGKEYRDSDCQNPDEHVFAVRPAFPHD
jgi:hypothetical protein